MRIFQRLAAVEGESPELPQNRSTELKGICLKYATAPCSVAICLALRLPIVSVMGPKAPYITFFPGVIFTAWVWRPRPWAARHIPQRPRGRLFLHPVIPLAAHAGFDGYHHRR